MNPAKNIKKTPGKSCEIGNSLKHNHQRMIDRGIPKYSNGANKPGSKVLYAEIKQITPSPPEIPMVVISIKSTMEFIVSKPLNKNSRLTAASNVIICVLN